MLCYICKYGVHQIIVYIYIYIYIQYCKFLSTVDIRRIQEQVYPHTLQLDSLFTIPSSSSYSSKLSPPVAADTTAVYPMHCESYTILKHTEIYPGRGDVQQLIASNLNECCQYCNQREECVSFTYTNTYCYLKSLTSPGNADVSARPLTHSGYKS